MQPRLPHAQAAGHPQSPSQALPGWAARERLLAPGLIQGLWHVLAAQLGKGDKVPKGSRGGETYFKNGRNLPQNGLG